MTSGRKGSGKYNARGQLLAPAATLLGNLCFQQWIHITLPPPLGDVMVLTLIEECCAELKGQTLTAVCRGYGSAIFLEFGRLTKQFRRDGSPTKPRGEITIMIEWSWRIEDETSILGGSWSEESDWEAIFTSLVGRTVENISVFGRLPELSVALSGGRYVSSFMTSDDQPAWTVFLPTEGSRKRRAIAVENGVIFETT